MIVSYVEGHLGITQMSACRLAIVLQLFEGHGNIRSMSELELQLRTAGWRNMT